MPPTTTTTTTGGAGKLARVLLIRLVYNTLSVTLIQTHSILYTSSFVSCRDQFQWNHNRDTSPVTTTKMASISRWIYKYDGQTMEKCHNRFVIRTVSIHTTSSIRYEHYIKLCYTHIFSYFYIIEYCFHCQTPFFDCLFRVFASTTSLLRDSSWIPAPRKFFRRITLERKTNNKNNLPAQHI